MSRVSNNPIFIPANIDISITSNNFIKVKGPLGELEEQIPDMVVVEKENDNVKIKTLDNSQQANAISGTYRALISNMVKGVTVGFERKLQLIGVGYRAQVNKQIINLTLGYSHPINYVIPEGITIETPTQTEIIVKGINKQRVGQIAAELRAFRKPEPYKGKGIRYSDEVIVLKETKKK